MSAAMTYLCVDSKCARCGATGRLHTCHACGARAVTVDCHHRTSPPPIAAGRSDGTDGHNDYCETCADAHSKTDPA